MFVQVMGASCAALCLVSLALCCRPLGHGCGEKEIVSCPADSAQVMESTEDGHDKQS